MSLPVARDAALLDLLASAGRLKRVKRAGWVQRGVREVESVADHSFRVALFALFTARARDDGTDADKCVRMALVHDLAECVVGDITPNDGVSDEEKREREGKAMRALTAACGAVGDEVRALWEEYEAGETKEAKLVKDADKLEMVMQASEYESIGDAGEGGKLEEFFESTRGRYKTERGTAWSEAIEERRPGGGVM
jgi:putative hydrolase of HD superfamily|tara:strand:- start:19009 stop:19596 length:588 start_codon:yes stop_codon:yes gene_type:complete